MDNPEIPFWERPEIVEQFAARPPDQRMMELLGDASRATRVLDLGCAGGRNTEWLAREGFDFYALDDSRAMLEKTRSRVEPYVGKADAGHRVVEGRMDNLSVFDRDFFDLIICFGVYHAAQSLEEWHCAIAESARILKPAAQLLMTQFSPRSDPTGQGLQRIEPHLFTGFRDERRMLLLEPDELDAWMAPYGFTPVRPTYDTTAPADEGGTRVVVNALYQKNG
ncbi:class I SAM-dependent methyltransferase [uncultured Meiothermus sp.]|uniref:class I SAM-dependent methyltransferase n=1 Tax=uncultured Meiothermus sp. TaxID=157471 RepID=UPI00262E1BAF|nr:class I SAM-dependent methyltransferase [uncultured Meiothermus sp.]